MRTLAFSIIITLALGIDLARAATVPNRFVTNTDAVAITLVPQIRDRGSNTELTLKFFGTNGNGATFQRAFLVFENTNSTQAGFHIMTSQETSDSTIMILLDNDRGNPTSLLNVTNFNKLFASIADSVIIGTPPGFLSAGAVSEVDSSVFGILNLASVVQMSQMDTSGFSTLASATNASRTIAHGFNAGVFFDAVFDDVLIGDSVMAVSGGISRDNVMIGSGIGSASSSATTNCIVIGYNLDPPVDGGTNQLDIGGTIFGTGLPLSPHGSVGAAKVGINVTSPAEILHVNGNVRANGGFVTSTNAAAASTAITFPSTGAKWTNTFGINIVLYVDNSGVTGTTVSKNGQQIFAGLVSDMTLLFKPGDYFSETFTVGTPSARWEPR